MSDLRLRLFLRKFAVAAKEFVPQPPAGAGKGKGAIHLERRSVTFQRLRQLTAKPQVLTSAAEQAEENLKDDVRARDAQRRMNR